MNEQAQAVEREQPEQAEQFAHLARAGQEALTDEMVTRLGDSASRLMELMDQVNRAELEQAIPTLERLVHSGDLERVAALARLVGAGEEALTDEMIGRLGGTASDTLDLLDRIHRADLAAAIPTLERVVHNGDLERMAELARLFGAAREALTEEMVGRLAGNVSELMALLDRLQSSGLLDRLIEAAPAINRLMAQLSPEVIDRLTAELPRAVSVLDQMQQMELAEDFLKCLQGATEEMPSQPEAKGGWMGLLSIMKQKDTQEMLQFVATLGKHFRRCRVERNGG